jgi:type I restriction enzyme M protein
MNLANQRSSERRSEYLLNDLLQCQGWDVRRPPSGDVLYQQEYRSHPTLAELLAKASKSGSGQGIPEAILVNRTDSKPLAVIEAKAASNAIGQAMQEAQSYAAALFENDWRPLAIGLAGTSDQEFKLRVSKLQGSKWQDITYDKNPISWIPTRADLDRIAAPSGPIDI